MSMTQRETGRVASGPFGLGEDDQEVVLHFKGGLAGFPASRQFKVEDLGERLRPFFRIRCVTEPTIAFTVVAPGLLFPDYTVEVDEEYVSQLSLTSSDDVITLVIVTTPPPPRAPTVNLLGPLVVNRNTWEAAQVVQHRSRYGVAEPVAVP